MPPVPGWKPVDSIEFITDGLGQVGTDISTFYTSEQMLLDNAASTDRRMACYEPLHKGAIQGRVLA